MTAHRPINGCPKGCRATGTTPREYERATPAVSAILPVFNEGSRLRETLAAIRDATTVPHEIIVVNDASTDSGCDFLRGDPAPIENVVFLDLPQHVGVAAARNLGAERARAPVLAAMDAHCIPHEGWLEKLLAELDKPGVGIVAPRITSQEYPDATAFGLTIRDRELGVGWLHKRADQPYAIPMAGCACMVMKREFFNAAGCFDAMRSYGMEDVEFCIRVWLMGYSVIMVPGAEVTHWFKNDPHPVGWHDFLYNRLRTAVLHFDGQRLERIFASLRNKPAFSEAVASLLTSDIWARQRFMREKRQRDADWFCQKFEIAI